MTKANPKPEPIALQTQQQLADLFGVTPVTIGRWIASGCPGSRGAYPLKEILAWVRTVGPWREKIPRDADELLYGSTDCPELRRYRAAKASLAELELAERQGELIRVDQLHEGILRMATVLRRYGEKAGKRWGQEAVVGHNECLDAMFSVATDYLSAEERDRELLKAKARVGYVGESEIVGSDCEIRPAE